MGIIVFFTGLVLVNYKTGGDKFALQRSANKLAQDIRRAEQMAMSAKECEVCGGIIPGGGYGIYLKQGDDYYLIYADTNPSQGNERYDGGNDDLLETIYFEKDVYIKNVSPSSLSINFKPPDPAVKISGDEDVTITLALEDDPGQERAITVNKAGLVEIE